MQYLLMSMLVGALFGGGMAIAQSPTEPPKESKKPRYIARFDEEFNSADKNGDGGLTRNEAESARMNRVTDNFDKLDADKDGKVTRNEIRALVRGKLTL